MIDDDWPRRASSGAGLSVVLPVRNAARTLAAQLEALVGAERPPVDLEVIVADNGSSDDTVALAHSFVDRLPVTVIDASDVPGANHARNRGIAAARHDRILLCDGDDCVDSHWLIEMAKAFDAGNVLIAGPIDYTELNPAHVRAWRGSRMAGVTSVLGFLPSGHGANLGFTRSVFDQVGGFDEKFVGGDDTDFCWRAQLAGFELHAVPNALVHYRLRPSLTGLIRQEIDYGVAEAQLYRKFASNGVRRRHPIAFVREAWWLLTRLPFAWSASRRGAWVRRWARQVGRIRGSIINRVWWL